MLKYKKLFWYVAIVAGVILVPTWIYLSYMQHVFAGRPHQPLPDMGWTTPLSEKGATVYVSSAEKTTMSWLTRIDMGLFAVAIGCLFLASGSLHTYLEKGKSRNLTDK